VEAAAEVEVLDASGKPKRHNFRGDGEEQVDIEGVQGEWRS
jgi:hypothetical protein